ncbi:ARMADILLO/BETA-CATENIN-LIKE REPEAT PROTEIN [Salix viminalis]|uniref:ARMADILLO/BETA-CATENIN-LIKE REPEAT PROTEIN n=1 Tax=Salix viminalis TaxID=40686 RepID=A0A9Q0V835_SALVM|nr:ARMADILLO/BETA-CATENIN-LIKE REPEAT PROTEIN [Salix viminalis]
MAKCHTNNNIGSLLLDHTTATATATGTHHSRLWTAFSRKLFDAVSCGGSSRYRQYEDDISSFTTTATNATASVSREKQNKTTLGVTNYARKENGNHQNLNVEGEKGRVKARNGKVREVVRSVEYGGSGE